VDDEQKTALLWLADQVIRYKKPTRTIWLLVTGSVFVLGAAYAFAKLVFIIYGGLLNAPARESCFRLVDGVRLDNGRTVYVLCASRGDTDAP